MGAAHGCGRVFLGASREHRTGWTTPATSGVCSVRPVDSSVTPAIHCATVAASTSIRDRQFNMRLNADELERLRDLAAHFGLQSADVVRMLVKREHDRVVSQQPSSLSKRKKRSR